MPANPLTRAVLEGAKWLWNTLNDLSLGIHTSDRVEQQASPGRAWPLGPDVGASARYSDNFVYAGTDYRNIRRILRTIGLTPNDVFYDVGCGKGRVLCVVARHPVRKVVGIELSASLSEVARENARRCRGRRAPIEVRCEDAARADYQDGTVFFFFNPFGRDTLSEVIAKIHHSWIENPRKLTLVYTHGLATEVLESNPWLERSTVLKTFTGKPIEVWKTRTSMKFICPGAKSHA